jgi:LemA protein
MIALYVIVGVVILLGIIVIALRNSLISRKNQVEYAFSSIDVMLKKRRDLIPNLVASVQQYMTHERELLTRLTELRSKVMQDLPDSERFAAENQIEGLLGRLRVAVENYPDLKANTNVLQLQAALNEVEEQISASRRAFNAAVMSYNNAVEMFPTSFFAQSMGYQRKTSFEIPQEQRENVNVKELFV